MKLLIPEVIICTETQHDANINGYIATGGLQTTLDKWLSNKNDTIQKPPATRRRCNDNYRWLTDFMCNNAISDAWVHESALTFLENSGQNNAQHRNTEQTGTGLQAHRFPTLDPTAPSFGLSDGDIAVLMRNGGVVDG